MNAGVKMHEKRFGVIGHPVKHSLSPLMHNAVFKKLGLKCKYGAFDIDAEELEQKVAGFKENFAGINVTIPHKVSIIKHLDCLSEEAKLVGAVNTVKFCGKTVGYNTDGIGCVKAFEESEVDPKGKKILIVGAGGAARAIGFQLAKEKAELWVSDKIMEKAFDLASEIKKKLNARVHATTLDGETLVDLIKNADVLINATPIGMTPNVDETPIDTDMLKKGLMVMDIVYNPVETKLLKEARKKGCKTISGVGMFVHQGAESLKIWLGIKPPIDVMRKTVVEALKKR
jgi:shikimate dehydrogenase